MGLLLVYFLNTWLPQIMRSADYDLGNSLGFLVVLNAGAGAGLLVAGHVGDRITPRNAAVIWFIGSAALLAALAYPWGFFAFAAVGALGGVAASALKTVRCGERSLQDQAAGQDG